MIARIAAVLVSTSALAVACASFTAEQDPPDASGDAGPPADASANADVADGPPLDAGMLAWWKFDEGEGGTSLDSIGKNTLTLAGPSFEPRSGGGHALRMDGVGHAGVAMNPKLVVTDALTLSVWVRLEAVPDSPYVYSHGYDFAVRLNGRALQFYGAGGDVVGDYDVPIGGWNHILVTFDRGTVAWFCNGISFPNRSSSLGDAGGLRHFEPATVAIGSSPENTNNARGAIDDVRLWDRVLSEAEIAAVFAGP